MAIGGSNRGINLSGNYWHIRGFDITRAGDNGMYVSGSQNIIESCSFSENNDSGLQLDGGASYNEVINCDSYYNYDLATNGGNADGFSPKLGVGVGNSFYGCRAWQNSDDGWDGYQAVSSTTIDNCWAFSNGYKMDGTDPGTQANGNGFKTGGNYTIHDNILKNCLSFYNKSKGFDQNHNRGSIAFLNCTAYDNGLGDGKPNFSVPESLASGKVLTVINCISFGSSGVSLTNPYVATNSWPDTSSYPTAFTTATSTDFIALDTAGARGQRKPDGSLPEISFMHLTVQSHFIDSGTNIGLPYYGLAPDIGCFESNIFNVVPDSANTDQPISYELYQNYPNPFNPITTIQFHVGKKGVVKLKIVNILGQEITVLYHGYAEPGRLYYQQFNAKSLPSGIYFSVLDTGEGIHTKKMVLVK